MTGLSSAPKGPPVLLLASASKARADLLRAAGYRFRQLATHIPEPPPSPGERPAAYALRLARLKANAALQSNPRALILAADTVVSYRGLLLGKAPTRKDALAMLQLLGGKHHEIVTALCLAWREKNGKFRRFEGVETARVLLRRWSPERLRRHIAVVRPFSCAGAYALQQGNSAIVQQVDGDPSTVIGLPIGLLDRWISRLTLVAQPTPPRRRPNAKSAATRHTSAQANTSRATSRRPKSAH